MRWILVLPVAEGSLWLILQPYALDFFLMTTVLPAVFIYSSLLVAPSNKDKVAWISASYWACDRLKVIWDGIHRGESSAFFVLSSLLGIIVGFAIANNASVRYGGGTFRFRGAD